MHLWQNWLGWQSVVAAGLEKLEKKNYTGSENTPHINQGKGATFGTGHRKTPTTKRKRLMGIRRVGVIIIASGLQYLRCCSWAFRLKGKSQSGKQPAMVKMNISRTRSTLVYFAKLIGM